MGITTWNDAAHQAVAQRVMSAVSEITLRIEAAAKAQLAPGRGKRTGALQRDIQARPPEIRGLRVVGRVGTGAATRAYALLVHRGRGPIVAKRGRMLRIVLADGTVIYRRRVGPAKAIPYMVDGYDQVKPSIRGIIEAALKG